MPELMQSTFDVLKYYMDRFKGERKVGTLITDKLLHSSVLLDCNPLFVPVEATRSNSELGESVSNHLSPHFVLNYFLTFFNPKAMVCVFANTAKHKAKDGSHQPKVWSS